LIDTINRTVFFLGFNAKIMRVGTLAARNSDGEYQINFTTNTFMGRLKSTLLIGKYPYEAMEMPFELSPIDFVAKAILLLAQAPKDCTVFHPFNNHTLIMGDLYTEMNKIGLHSQGAEYEEYMKRWGELVRFVDNVYHDEVGTFLEEHESEKFLEMSKGLEEVPEGGSVINRVNRVTAGEFLIDTTIILVVMIDVSILLQNRMAFSV
jgi:thioester reductase-like protein